MSIAWILYILVLIGLAATGYGAIISVFLIFFSIKIIDQYERAVNSAWANM